jgi:hypothetical protein
MDMMYAADDTEAVLHHGGAGRDAKDQARRLGISEAELARRALSEFLSERSPMASRRPGALQALLGRTRTVSEKHRLPSGYRFDREDLYSDRIDGPSGPGNGGI